MGKVFSPRLEKAFRFLVYHTFLVKIDPETSQQRCREKHRPNNSHHQFLRTGLIINIILKIGRGEWPAHATKLAQQLSTSAARIVGNGRQGFV